MAPTSALPIGASRVVDEMQPVIVDPAQGGSGLLNAVLALLAPVESGVTDETDVLDNDVLGFLIVCACLVTLPSLQTDVRESTVCQ